MAAVSFQTGNESCSAAADLGIERGGKLVRHARVDFFA
jgi:hypothetical protein